MKTLLFLSRVPLTVPLLALLCALPASALTTSTNRTFTASPGGRLIIQADRGSVRITSADTQTVDVTVEREVQRSSDDKAREVLEAHELTFEQAGDVITVRAHLPRSDSLWSRKTSGLGVKYLVTVPSRFDLSLSTAGGSIQVDDHAGNVALRTSGGSVRVGQLTGDVTARTAGGSISVSAASGRVEADSSGGSIKLGKMNGPVDAQTAGGSIRIESASVAVKANTSGGSIVVNGASGPVEADTAGGSITVRYVGKPEAAGNLECTGGGITVYLADTVGFAVDAASTGGGVRSELPVESAEKSSRTRLKGNVGGGGAALKLRSTGGGISLRKLSADAR